MTHETPQIVLPSVNCMRHREMILHSYLTEKVSSLKDLRELYQKSPNLQIYFALVPVIPAKAGIQSLKIFLNSLPMHKLTLLLIPLILLSSCTIDWNDEKDAKITTLEKQVTELKEKNDDELFKKRQECSSLFDSINFRLKNYKSDYTFELEEVFYSPKLGQCVYIDYFQSDITIKRLMSIGNNVG